LPRDGHGVVVGEQESVKRSEALQSLSRDHQHALAVALKLTRAEDAEDAARAFLAFWRTEGRKHFRVEEEVLLPGWFRLGAVDEAGIARLGREHLEIRAAALAMAEQPDLDEVRALGRRLTDHVRFEERELFELIERDLGEKKLQQLAQAVLEAEGGGR
jgi:hemerythrin-like domain-containing protein